LTQEPEVVDRIGNMPLRETRISGFGTVTPETQSIHMLIEQDRMAMIVYYRNGSEIEHTPSYLFNGRRGLCSSMVGVPLLLPLPAGNAGTLD